LKEEEIRGRILVVDDEPMNVLLLRRLLSPQHEIFSTDNGPDALEIASDEAVDLILLDVMMPDMDGFEVCQRLKQNTRTMHIPVVFISALGEIADEAKGLEIGGIDYITKPIKGPIVKARVRNHLALKRYQDKLSDLASIDGLTSIANRRKFDEVLEQEWRRNERAQTPLSVMLCDIDFFKQYNDHYGHLAGDDCLKQVAKTLEAVGHRPYDLVARYGGEEFAFILPQTESEGAGEIARKALEEIRALQIPHESSKAEAYVTLSIGYSTIIPTSSLSSEALLQQSDEALYQAKEGGRNQSCVKTFIS